MKINSLPGLHLSAILNGMKLLPALLLPLALGGCIVEKAANTAFDVVTLPVKAVSAGVKAVTPSQKKADAKMGAQLRKQDEERGKQYRLAAERCRRGQGLPTDNCYAAPVQR